MTAFGVHTGLQNTTIGALRDLWTRIEDHGFDWISIWDHFYSADFSGYECHEAVACHAALACHTSRVRVGSLVYCAATVTPPCWPTPSPPSTTSPAGGRSSGWAPAGRRTSTRPTGSRSARAGERLDLLEESHPGDPRPSPPGGHRRSTAPTSPSSTPAASPSRSRTSSRSGWGAAARSARCASPLGCADGWNVPFVAPETLAHKRGVLHRALRRGGARPGGDPHGGERGPVRGRRRSAGPVRGVGRGSAARRADRLARPARPPHRGVRRGGGRPDQHRLRAPWDLSLLDLATEAIEQLR